jgi:mono/diheme cytochrome c family protein
MGLKVERWNVGMLERWNVEDEVEGLAGAIRPRRKDGAGLGMESEQDWMKLMRKKTLLAGVVILVVMIGAVGMALKLGLVPVNADASPSSLEMRIFPMVLHASVARQAERTVWSRPLSDEDVTAGREIYSVMCAECHGRLDGRAGALGMSFYPPAPQLPGHAVSYSDRETFWLVKHGIRNTGMPSWGKRLSDQDIWNVVAFLRGVKGDE